MQKQIRTNNSCQPNRTTNIINYLLKNNPFIRHNPFAVRGHGITWTKTHKKYHKQTVAQKGYPEYKVGTLFRVEKNV